MVKSIAKKTCVAALILAGIAVLVFHDTLAGTWALRVATWDEEAYVGRDLHKVKAELERNQVEVRRCDAGSLFSQTGWKLGARERALVYRHGDPYSWFRVGTAVNLGYIVTKEGQADGIQVVAILKGRQVDAP